MLKICVLNLAVLSITYLLPPFGRDSGNNFGRFSVPFLEGRISDICAAFKFTDDMQSSRIMMIEIQTIEGG